MIPDEFPAVPDDFDGAMIYEVKPEWRSGRGRWWRPNGHGYTNDPQEVGLYRSVAAVIGSERHYAVDVRVLAQAMREEGGRCLAIADILDVRADAPVFRRDDRLGLPGDDLRLEYRVALLVACPAPDCGAPVGFLCRGMGGLTGFHDSRWLDGARRVSAVARGDL